MTFPELYSVIVYCDDGRQERYLFSSIYDVEASIDYTWSKVRDTVYFTRPSDITAIMLPRDCQVQVHDVATNKLLLDCYRIQSTDVLDGPTHF